MEDDKNKNGDIFSEEHTGRGRTIFEKEHTGWGRTIFADEHAGWGRTDWRGDAQVTKTNTHNLGTFFVTEHRTLLNYFILYVSIAMFLGASMVRKLGQKLT